MPAAVPHCSRWGAASSGAMYARYRDVHLVPAAVPYHSSRLLHLVAAFLVTQTAQASACSTRGRPTSTPTWAPAATSRASLGLHRCGRLPKGRVIVSACQRILASWVCWGCVQAVAPPDAKRHENSLLHFWRRAGWQQQQAEVAARAGPHTCQPDDARAGGCVGGFCLGTSAEECVP